MLGGGGLSLFGTRPLEDILADLDAGWNDIKCIIGKLMGSSVTEVAYVL